jgi:hypothetical protein
MWGMTTLAKSALSSKSLPVDRALAEGIEGLRRKSDAALQGCDIYGQVHALAQWTVSPFSVEWRSFGKPNKNNE